jgi:hypothetical protein
MIKSRRMSFVGHIARIRAQRNICGILMGKPKGKRRIGRPRHRCVDTIKLDPRDIQWGGVGWIHFARYRNQLRALVNTVMNPQVP